MQFSIEESRFRLVKRNAPYLGGANTTFCIQEALLELTGRSTVPNVFIKGKNIGGGTEMAELHQSGKLKTLLQEHGIIKE